MLRFLKRVMSDLKPPIAGEIPLDVREPRHLADTPPLQTATESAPTALAPSDAVATPPDASDDSALPTAEVVRVELPLMAAIRAIQQHAGQPADAAKIVDAVVANVVRPYHRSLSWGDRLLTLDKSASFMRDEKFREALAACSSSTGQTQYDAPEGIAWRHNTLIWAARSVLDLPGDFVECGVYKGDMSWVVSEMVDLAAVGKSLYLFDSFEGFSPKYSSEEDFPEAPQLHRIADDIFKEPGIFEYVRARFSEKPYAKVIRGFVPDVLSASAPSRIAFLHVDMNSAAPEVAAMQALFPRVSPGGIVVLDDYGWILHRRQKEAHDEFAATMGYRILELPTGQGLIVKRP